MKRHTPGPWTDLDLTWGHQILATHRLFPGGLIVATVNDENPDEQVAAANARLIALAPQMLEALRGIVQDIESGQEWQEHIGTLISSVWWEMAVDAVVRMRAEVQP